VNPHLAWYVARAAGIVAWGLLSAAVIWGLLLSTRVLQGRPTPRWLLDLHRFLGGLAVVFTGVHVGGLVADNYLHFGLADVLVPLASRWRPGVVALGVVGLWLLLAVEITSLLMRSMPRRWWHRVHLTSYVLFWTATLHGLLAGTDASQKAFALAVDAAATLVLGLTIVRVLAPRRRTDRSKTATPRAPSPGNTRRLPPPPTAGPPTAPAPAIPIPTTRTNRPLPPPLRSSAPAPTAPAPTARTVRPLPPPSPPPPPTWSPPPDARVPAAPRESAGGRPSVEERARALAARRRPTPEQRRALAAQRGRSRPSPPRREH
jgi:DMSO/TMAO reductase YedYZ heme-binding membrane subunit